MGKYTGELDRTNFVTLRPAITRAFFDAPRAWNGSEVLLSVETRFVPDGTPVKLAIVAERGRTDPVEELPDAEIKGGRCRVKHKLEWDHEKLAGVPNDGPAVHFLCVVKVPRFGLEARSTPLYVDRGDFSHSS